MTKLFTTAAIALSITASAAMAHDWNLDAQTSHLAFGSIKNSYLGETHAFSNLSGTVTESGQVSIQIPLSSVETGIDIRNERIGKYVFKAAPTATLTAAVDMDTVAALHPGETTTMELEATLSLLGEDVDVYTEIFVARLSDSRVMITTNDMLFLDTDELGIDAGIDKLQELASLDSISRATPITARFIFEH